MKIATMAALIMALLGCDNPFRNYKDHSRDQWLPHKPTAWGFTPAGHLRDAGPFASVDQGFITQDEIDAAIDAGFIRFGSLFPEFAVPNSAVTLNDDYVMWEPRSGQWAGGIYYGDNVLRLTIWTRGTSSIDPGAQFIKRSPAEYWGVWYDVWRFTALPPVPALEHELLHVVIGDPGHVRPEWSRLSAVSGKASVRVQTTGCQEPAP